MSRLPLLLTVLRSPEAMAALGLDQWDLLLRQAERSDISASLLYLAEDHGLLAALPAALAENAEQTSFEQMVLVYMVGSDLEDEGGMASRDISEMLESGFDEESTCILLMVGGSNAWAPARRSRSGWHGPKSLSYLIT